MQAEEISETLCELALDEGFDFAGITPLGPSNYSAELRQWLDRGDAADMTYMSGRFDERTDSRKLVTGATSALCVAIQYHPLADNEASDNDLWPFVARYARGRDYHDVMSRRLKRLADRIDGHFPGCTLRSYVDTGPILERELAALAGLGAIGKNTNLLNPRVGSWLLLGELFLNLEAGEQPPIADLCGSCTKCLDACPTGALPEPYRLDSRRCISYWTIEHRDVVPQDVRPTLGQWVFGCDICQEVCPLNEDSNLADQPDLRLSEKRRHLDLQGLLGISRDHYVEIFRGSPMKRAKQVGLQRNAAIAMGNSRNQKYLPSLVKAMNSDSPVVRRHVVWAIAQIGGVGVLQILKDQYTKETDVGVRAEIDLILQAASQNN